MTNNLIYSKWIPILRQSGKRGHITTWQLTEPDDPIISLACRRPDFNGALMQFLIGLLQTVAAPKDHDTWVEWLERPLGCGQECCNGSFEFCRWESRGPKDG